MKYTFDYAILDAINNAIRTVKASPLILGATPSGTGGPIGGYIGYLPQNKVSFDSVEASGWTIPSGATLVSNLDRIRYRLGVLESGGSGHTIMDEGIALSNRKYLNFVGSGVLVTDDIANNRTIVTISTVTSSGTVSSGSSTFLGLTDTPSSYVGSSGYIVKVDSDQLVFSDVKTLLNYTAGRVMVSDINTGLLSPADSLSYATFASSFSGGFYHGDPSKLIRFAAHYVDSVQTNDANAFNISVVMADTLSFAARRQAYRGGGSTLSPTATKSGMVIQELRGAGVDAPGSITNGAITVMEIADGDWSPSSHPTRLEVWTTPSGSIVLTKALTIGSNGNLDIASGKYYQINGVNIASITDGDKGDITVASGGSSMNVDNGAITLPKIVNTTQYKLMGRSSAGSGVWQEIASSSDVFSILQSADYSSIRTLLSIPTDIRFGNAVDGNVTISVDTTLSRDMYYNNLTINSSITLYPAGYKIFVAGTLLNNGTISVKGGNGSAPVGATGGVAGVRPYTFSPWFATPTAGGTGGNSGGGGTLNSTGGNSPVANIVVSKTPISLRAGGGGGGGSGHGAAPTAGAVPLAPFAGAVGGDGGDGATATSSSNGGGAGGSGGGVMEIWAYIINNAGTFTAAGGDGSNGNNTARSGGGGGGGGGAISLYYHSTTGSGIGTLTAAGGVAGVGAGAETDGAAGSTVTYAI